MNSLLPPASSPLPAVVAAIALGALALYAVTGGADFGAGLWDRLAFGPRKNEQRAVIEHALAPIWETNHVWLIFVVVVLFSAFPQGFAAVGIALNVPLTLALVGIVLRGAAFVFRQYGQGTAAGARRWGRIFGAGSMMGPFFLGLSLAAVSGGQIRVAADGSVAAPAQAWWGLFPVAVGLFVVALFAFVAAVYLCVEADEAPVRDDFRRRALIGRRAGGTLLAAWSGSPPRGRAPGLPRRCSDHPGRPARSSPWPAWPSPVWRRCSCVAFAWRGCWSSPRWCWWSSGGAWRNTRTWWRQT